MKQQKEPDIQLEQWNPPVKVLKIFSLVSPLWCADFTSLRRVWLAAFSLNMQILVLFY